jgi:hypothetical protein
VAMAATASSSMRASSAGARGPWVSRGESWAAINFESFFAGETAVRLPSQNGTGAMRSYIAVALIQADYRRIPTRKSSRISSAFNNSAAQCTP